MEMASPSPRKGVPEHFVLSDEAVFKGIELFLTSGGPGGSHIPCPKKANVFLLAWPCYADVSSGSPGSEAGESKDGPCSFFAWCSAQVPSRGTVT